MIAGSSKVTEPAASETSSPEEIVAWSLSRFAHQRMVLTTSFGMEGCALIDMYAKHQQPMTVVYLDTMFFFPETYALRDQMVERYPTIEFINRGTSLTPQQQADAYGKELWKTDPSLCCALRKVAPMANVMKDVDVWITGLRRDQSSSRTHVRVADWDWKFEVLKISPLAHWSRCRVWEYVKTHNVPYNVLHEQGYPSIGCTHCTQVVEGLPIGEYSRDGRWGGADKTECGLHEHGSGI
jgi:phosphoadenosine phosphosulfate reductase